MPTPLRLLTATVLARREVTPAMVRVTLGGDGLTELVTTGVGDEYVRLFFPDPETGELVLPEIDDKGRWRYPKDKTPSHCECYTVRNARPGEIDLDFVVHEHGRASEWAQAAQPGETITLREPAGIYNAPEDARWQLFLADATGLPAVGRLLEQLPKHVEARVIIEIPDASHRQPLTGPDALEVIWVEGAGNGIAASRLPEILEAMQLPDQQMAHVWVGAEARACRQIRRLLRHTLGWDGKRYSVTAYWTDRLEAWQERWEALDPALKQRIEDLWVSGRDQEDIRDEVEETLEPHGL